MCDLADAGTPIHNGTVVVTVAQLGFAGMYRAADADVGALLERPCEGSLKPRGGGDGVGERGLEQRDRAAHAGLVALPQTRRALDVGQQERDSPGRQLTGRPGTELTPYDLTTNRPWSTTTSPFCVSVTYTASLPSTHIFTDNVSPG